MDCDFTTLYHHISSKLEEFKKYISKLFINENSQLFHIIIIAIKKITDIS